MSNFRGSVFRCNLVERTQDRGGKISSQSSAPGVLTTRAKVCDPPPRGQGRGDCLVPVEPPGRRKGCPEVSLTLRTPQVLQHPVPCQRTTGARSSVRAPRITPSLLPAPRVSVPSPVPLPQRGLAASATAIVVPQRCSWAGKWCGTGAFRTPSKSTTRRRNSWAR